MSYVYSMVINLKPFGMKCRHALYAWPMRRTWPLGVDTWWALPNRRFFFIFFYFFSYLSLPMMTINQFFLQTCRDCGSKLSKCPLCREEITSHIRLFPGWILGPHELFSCGVPNTFCQSVFHSVTCNILHTSLILLHMCTLRLFMPCSGVTYTCYLLLHYSTK